MNETATPTTMSVVDFLTDSWNITGNMTDNLTDIITTTTRKPVHTPQRYLIDYTNYFVKVYTYTAYLTGIPGNILTMIILARMRPVTSVQVWLTGLSFLDFCTLAVRGFTNPFISYKLMKYSTPLCIFRYISSWTSEYCNYMFFLGMTIERFIAVWFPLRMASWTSPTYALIGMLAVFWVILLIQLHHFWTFYHFKNDCYTRLEYQAFWNDIWVDKVEAFALRAIPLISVIVLNILIIVRLKMSQKINTALSDDQLKEKQKQQRQINRLLSVATVFFVISIGPDLLFRFTGRYWSAEDIFVSWIAARNYLIMMKAFAALRTGNHAGNFFCYIIVARKFRNELLHLVTCGAYGEHNGVKGTRVKKAMLK